jgi:hypothetical protein
MPRLHLPLVLYPKWNRHTTTTCIKGWSVCIFCKVILSIKTLFLYLSVPKRVYVCVRARAKIIILSNGGFDPMRTDFLLDLLGAGPRLESLLFAFPCIKGLVSPTEFVPPTERG